MRVDDHTATDRRHWRAAAQHEALKEDDVRAKLANVGLEPVGSTPDAFAAMIKAETRKWGDIVRKAGLAASE